ncbi:H-NS family nucleoid-associated regulatory protein [Tepidicella xavieri]|uniref:DNA-binding protein H-NS n=1 Tax=Tepidicella xavieri TaxID=360241 RepID=A0A4R6U6N6_9BURK|nr:H-NS histone family protein [Tepidicella xavieri]TDQ41951.1 DNA-binding protein H-NS [Tepidicella xavieri]
MATYSELMAQAQALMAQAEQVRKQELAQVIADIKTTMRQYGLTVEDLGVTPVRVRPAGRRTKAPAKYRGPNGELWSGGPGRKPEWVKAILAEGKDIEAYRI